MVRNQTRETFKNHTLWERPTLEHFVKDCVPYQGPHGEEHEEEGAEMKHYELSPVPRPPTLVEGRQ